MGPSPTSRHTCQLLQKVSRKAGHFCASRALGANHTPSTHQILFLQVPGLKFRLASLFHRLGLCSPLRSPDRFLASSFARPS